MPESEQAKRDYFAMWRGRSGGVSEDPQGMEMPRPDNARGLRIAAAAAVVFGLLTIKEGAAVLFGGEAARVAAGHYVPFVLWFNFLGGFAYVIAGVGLWVRRRWAVWLALCVAVGTAAVFAALGIHILLGGTFEMRTVAAMILRTTVWLVIFAYATRRIATAS